MAIQEDEFAREDNQSFALVAVECLEAVIQQLDVYKRQALKSAPPYKNNQFPLYLKAEI